MIISHSGKFIFFHVPRTGGSSITHALRSYIENRKNKRAYSINPYDLAEWQSQYHIDGNLHGAYRRKRNWKLCNDYPNYFKFAFVRNPWKRTFSEFCGHIRDPKNYQYDLSPEGLEQFLIEFLYPQKGYRIQSWYFTDYDGNIAIDYIARFENWSNEFQYITETVLNLKNIRCPNLNKSESSLLNYQDFFTDRTKEIVRLYHEKDIELFGYTFKD